MSPPALSTSALVNKSGSLPSSQIIGCLREVPTIAFPPALLSLPDKPLPKEEVKNVPVLESPKIVVILNDPMVPPPTAMSSTASGATAMPPATAPWATTSPVIPEAPPSSPGMLKFLEDNNSAMYKNAAVKLQAEKTDKGHKKEDLREVDEPGTAAQAQISTKTRISAGRYGAVGGQRKIFSSLREDPAKALPPALLSLPGKPSPEEKVKNVSVFKSPRNVVISNPMVPPHTVMSSTASGATAMPPATAPWATTSPVIPEAPPSSPGMLKFLEDNNSAMYKNAAVKLQAEKTDKGHKKEDLREVDEPGTAAQAQISTKTRISAGRYGGVGGASKNEEENPSNLFGGGPFDHLNLELEGDLWDAFVSAVETPSSSVKTPEPNLALAPGLPTTSKINSVAGGPMLASVPAAALSKPGGSSSNLNRLLDSLDHGMDAEEEKEPLGVLNFDVSEQELYNLISRPDFNQPQIPKTTKEEEERDDKEKEKLKKKGKKKELLSPNAVPEGGGKNKKAGKKKGKKKVGEDDEGWQELRCSKRAKRREP